MFRLNQKGVTLLELLAAIALMSVILGLCFTLIHTMTSGFNRISTREAVQEQARMITEQISNTIREAPATITNLSDGIVVAELKDNTLTGNYASFIHTGTNLVMKSEKDGNIRELNLAENVADASIKFNETDNKVVIILKFNLNGVLSHAYETSIYTPQWTS